MPRVFTYVKFILHKIHTLIRIQVRSGMNSKQLKSSVNSGGALRVWATCLGRAEVNVQGPQSLSGFFMKDGSLIGWLHWPSNNPARFVIGGQLPAAAPAPDVSAECQTSGPQAWTASTVFMNQLPSQTFRTLIAFDNLWVMRMSGSSGLDLVSDFYYFIYSK